VTFRDQLLGAISVAMPAAQPITPAARKLVDDLASQAGLVLSNVRLAADLEFRLEQIAERAAELRASRQRIVAAQDDERRRLERNIHDGAQQHLVALAVKLRLARALVRTDPAKAQAMLGELESETEEALDTLIDLSRGIYPPLLEEQGIAAALAAQYTRSGLDVHMTTDGARRYAIEVEAAVYFCVLEALQNAAKYAGDGAIVVAIGERSTGLEFSVTDHGRGFDPDVVRAGSGLQNMTDRVSVLGGTVRVESVPGAGTVVRGSVPLVEAVAG
jgi:signal transduction histidine kinase